MNGAIDILNKWTEICRKHYDNYCNKCPIYWECWKKPKDRTAAEIAETVRKIRQYEKTDE